MPLEKKYRQVQGLQSQIFLKNGNSPTGKAGISVKMTVRRFSLPEFPENLQSQVCAKPDFGKCGFAMMPHASGKKIRVCATFHTLFSAEFSQVHAFTRHFFLNIERLQGSPVSIPQIMACEKVILVFLGEKGGGEQNNLANAAKSTSHFLRKMQNPRIWLLVFGNFYLLSHRGPSYPCKTY
jgi:hypothetical protein